MKKLLIISLLITLILTFVGCTYDAIDATISYSKAYIYLPNGEVIEGKVEKWRDYEDGDQLQVKINGKTYLTHATNVVLVKE